MQIDWIHFCFIVTDGLTNFYLCYNKSHYNVIYDTKSDNDFVTFTKDIFVYFQHFVLFFINLTEQGEKCSTSPTRQLVYTQLLNWRYWWFYFNISKLLWMKFFFISSYQRKWFLWELDDEVWLQADKW